MLGGRRDDPTSHSWELFPSLRYSSGTGCAGGDGIGCSDPRHPGDMAMGLPVFQVDAFTNKPFAGNPAAVCVTSEPCESSWMQSVAREMNLSETAFVRQCEDGFELRWFTPAIEVDLCGHATLATAHILWQERIVPRSEPARFHTRSGVLTARCESSWITMDFPAEPPQPVSGETALIDALGLHAEFVGRNRLDYIVQACCESDVRTLEPDFAALSHLEMRGVIVTAKADSTAYDFVSRYFAPRAGIDEDPVTGSAHCCLGPHWARRLGKTELIGYQASARGGTVHVAMADDRVLLKGQVVTVWRGEFVYPCGV